MTASQNPHEDILSPQKEGQKRKNVKASKLFSKIIVLCLLALIFVIFMGVLWQRYLEPKFKFENVVGGQSTPEALSLAPIIQDAAPSTFEGASTPPVAVPAPAPIPTKESLMNDLLESLRAHINSGKNEEGEATIQPLQQEIEKLKKEEFTIKVSLVLNGLEKGVVSLSEFKDFLKSHPEAISEQLKTRLLSLERILSFEELYVMAKTIQNAVPFEEESPRFLDKVKRWMQSLITVEKGENISSNVHDEFLAALQKQDLKKSLEVYAKLSPELQQSAKDIYNQLKFKETFLQEQRQVFLNFITGEK